MNPSQTIIIEAHNWQQLVGVLDSLQESTGVRLPKGMIATYKRRLDQMLNESSQHIEDVIIENDGDSEGEKLQEMTVSVVSKISEYIDNTIKRAIAYLPASTTVYAVATAQGMNLIITKKRLGRKHGKFFGRGEGKNPLQPE